MPRPLAGGLYTGYGEPLFYFYLFTIVHVSLISQAITERSDGTQ